VRPVKHYLLKTALLPVFAMLLANQTLAAGNNDPPPAGPVIDDLNGTLVPHAQTLYTTQFTASSTTTNFSFAFREDPAFLELSDVTVTTGGGPNILLNGDFALGPIGVNQPTDWTYLNVYNSEASGVTYTGCGFGGSNCYFDGSVQAYDAITQSLTTIANDVYTVSFYLDDNGSLTTFSGLSTNGNTTSTGGNGIDLLVYAGNGVPIAATPLPAAFPLFAAGLGVMGWFGRRRKRISAAFAA
jgi:hypothetical protein